MAEFARAKDVHKTLRSVWDTALQPLGFKRCRGSIASYYRSSRHPGKFVRFWTQISQWGDDWSGSRFRITFDNDLDDPHSGFFGADNTISTLPRATFEEAESISKRIIERIPRPPREHWIYEAISKESEQQEFWAKSFHEAFHYSEGALTRSKDVWFNYFSCEDVADWAIFTSKFIPELVE